MTGYSSSKAWNFRNLDRFASVIEANKVLSTTKVVDRFISGSVAVRKVDEDVVMVPKSATLDIHPLKFDLVNVVQPPIRTSLEHLRVVCSVLDPRLSDSVVRILQSIQWSKLKSLELFDNSIDSWIQMLRRIGALQLKRLDIRGTDSILQKISYASIRILLQWLEKSLLAELHFDNVQLQDPCD